MTALTVTAILSGCFSGALLYQQDRTHRMEQVGNFAAVVGVACLAAVFVMWVAP